MSHILLTVSLLSCIAVQAWSADAAPPATPATPATLGTLTPGVDYRVVRLNDRVVPVELSPTLKLDAQAKRVTGFSGVNRYGGGYELTATTLTIAQPFSTMMAGEDAAMKTETEFLGVISQPLTISAAADGGLLLRSGKGTLLLVVPATPAK